jgi:hypothetical protein
MYLRTSVTVSISIFLHLLTLANSPDLLVELALQEKKRRSAVVTECPLYTNQDLSRLPLARVSLGGETPVKREKAPEKVPMMIAGSRTEEVRKNSIDSAGGRLAAAVNRVHVLQLRHNHLRNLYLNATDELQRMRIEQELKGLLAELEEAEAEERKARESWRKLKNGEVHAGPEPGEVVNVDSN